MITAEWRAKLRHTANQILAMNSLAPHSKQLCEGVLVLLDELEEQERKSVDENRDWNYQMDDLVSRLGRTQAQMEEYRRMFMRCSSKKERLAFELGEAYLSRDDWKKLHDKSVNDCEEARHWAGVMLRRVAYWKAMLEVVIGRPIPPEVQISQGSNESVTNPTNVRVLG